MWLKSVFFYAVVHKAIMAVVCFETKFLHSFEVNNCLVLTLSGNYRKKWKNLSAVSFVLIFVFKARCKFQQIKQFCSAIVTVKVGRFEEAGKKIFQMILNKKDSKTIHIEMLKWQLLHQKTADQYTCHMTGSLISISVFLLAWHKKYQQSKYGP